MADWHGGGVMAAQDFEEEEVWAMMKPTQASNSNPKIKNNLSSSYAWHFTATSRSNAISRSAGSVHQSSPAPVNIPDWSKILKKKPTQKITWDGGDDDDDGDGSWGSFDCCNMLPPHEYLARRVASAQNASFSMCEGIGRTLKGRDLTNLRKAILTKTGFLE